MELTVRKANERGRAQFNWLDSRHTFSFGEYHDSKHMGFGTLRVINDDRVAPGAGFPTHAHAEMEIVTYVLEGTLEHKDSLGTGSVIQVGDVQRMSAGKGIRHSEFNGSQTAAVHFLQIWIFPDEQGLAPSYEQKTYSAKEKQGTLRPVASRDGHAGSVVVHQDVNIYATILSEKDVVTHDLAPGRQAWLQLARGSLSLNGEILHEGDGVGIDSSGLLRLEGIAAAEALLFDMGRQSLPREVSK